MDQNVSEQLQGTFTDVLQSVIASLDEIIIALLLIALGFLVGSLLKRLIIRAADALGIDSALKRVGAESALEKTGYRLRVGKLLGALVKWFVIIVFLVVSLNILGLTEINEFLQADLLPYLPRVFVAIIILIIGAIAGGFVEDLVESGARGAGVRSYDFLGSLARWAIWIFASVAALSELGVAETIVQTFFMGIVFAFALSFGLAFGLGGRDAASRYIEKVEKEIQGVSSDR